MIVIGIDPHKGSHTAVAVEAGSGRLIASKTVKARDQGHHELVVWARTLGDARAFAIEDCRHVSGGLERFLLGRGEQVVRVAPKLMAGSRNVERERGKSDDIDALSVARAAVREGLDTLPCARLDAESLEIKLLLDHREDLVAERTRDQNRLRWHLHDLDPELHIPAGALDRLCWLEKIANRLARLEQTARVRISRSLVRRLRALARECNQLETEISTLIRQHAPELLDVHGCGALTAAKLVAETAGADRFRSEASFARHAGVAPVPVVLRAPSTPSPRSWRQPTTQLRAAPHRRRPSPHDGTRRRRISRRPSGRRQEPPRRAALPQTPPSSNRLEAPHHIPAIPTNQTHPEARKPKPTVICHTVISSFDDAVLDIGATFEREDLGVVDEAVDHRGGGDLVTEDLTPAENGLLLVTISEARS